MPAVDQDPINRSAGRRHRQQRALAVIDVKDLKAAVVHR
jgi:hypothetical protein